MNDDDEPIDLAAVTADEELVNNLAAHGDPPAGDSTAQTLAAWIEGVYQP